MPVITRTLTGDLGDLVGGDLNPKRTSAWIETNLPKDAAVIDTAGNRVNLGDKRITLGADGKFSVAGLIDSNSTDVNPTGMQYRVVVDYALQATPRRQRWASGWFSLTADVDLAAVSAEQYVPPTYISTLTGQLDAHEATLESDMTAHSTTLKSDMTTHAGTLEADMDAKAAAAQTSANNASTSASNAAASATAADLSATDAASSAAQAAAPTAQQMATVDADPNSAVRQQQDARNLATFAGKRAALRGNRFVWLGDSITIGQGNESTAAGPQESWGMTYPSFATYASKGRIVRLRNAGVSGNRAVDMLNRFDADVAAHSPSVVSIMAGTNDWNDAGPTPLDTYQQNIRDLVAKCRGINAQPILCTVPPNVISAARRKRTIIGNTWLRQYAAAEGIPLVDFYALLTDPATGDYLAAYGSAGNDKTHPITAGYKAMGEFFWNSLSSGVLSPVDVLLPMENADPNNLLTNGLNLTTAGSGTSLMPTGWTVQTGVHPTGVTGSLVTGDTTIKGNWWKVTADGTASSTNNEYQTVSGIVPGHVYAHVGRFKATGMRGSDTGSGSGFLIGTAFNSTLNQLGYDFRAANTHYYDMAEGVYFQTMTAPANASTALVRRQLLNATAGAGTLQVSQSGFYDLTAMGLA